MTLAERDLLFDFAGVESVLKLDAQGVRQEAPQGMKLVDFAVREANRILLIEVKDPCDSLGLPEDARHYARKLRYRSLVREELVPKCRDTYSYLHLMDVADLPIWFVLVLGVDEVQGVGLAELGALQDLLYHCLRCETPTPWARRYVEGAVVVSPLNWGEYFPYTVTRIPQRQEPAPALRRPERYRPKRRGGRGARHGRTAHEPEPDAGS
jgi:hypothetical protein